MTPATLPACAVLLIGTDPVDATLVKHALDNACSPVCRVERVNLAVAIDRLRRGDVDVILLVLSDSRALEIFQVVFTVAPAVPIVVVTDDDKPRASELLESGAQDCLLKQDISPQLLAHSIRYAIERRRAAVLEPLNRQLEQVKRSLTKTLRKLELTNKKLAHFSYFASHDLQEPVRKINYFAGKLKEHLHDRLNEVDRHDFDFILDAGRRRQALIHSLRALSQADNAEVEWGPVDLELCVNEALECLAARIDETQAVVVRAPLPVVKGNGTLLNQLYQNLIGNAIKFTAGNKHPRIELTASHRGTQWALGVRDNGIGIEPAFAHVIFSRFQRVNFCQQYEGAGVGLTICKKVVQHHGGRIWVESKPGAGAHFKFLLTGHEGSGCPASAEIPARAATESPIVVKHWFRDGKAVGGRSPSPRILRAFLESHHGQPDKLAAG